MSFFPGKSAQSRPLGLVTLQPGGTSRVRKPREKFFFFSPGRTENDPRSSGLPTGTCRGVGEGCGTGMAFWGRWGKRGSLEHCRGAEPRDEAEGRHGTQKALLRFREKKSSNLILHSRAGQNHSPSSMAYADTRAGGLPAALSAPKKLWAFTPSSPNAAEHPSPLSQMPAHGDRGPEQVRNHCIGVGWTS